MFSKIHFNSYAFAYKILAGSFGVFTLSSYYNGSEKFYSNFITPLINYFGIEKAHQWTFITNKYHLIPRNRYQDPRILECQFYGVNIQNPLGMGSGFDKGGETVTSLFDIGFGFVEIGTIELSNCKTFKVYEEKPENNYARLASFIRHRVNDPNESIINRIKDAKRKNLRGMVGINLECKNNSSGVLNDYIAAVNTFGPVADYLAFNLNPQSEIKLDVLMETLRNTCDSLKTNKKPLLLLKLPEDLTPRDRNKLLKNINQHPNQINGVIVSLTNDDNQQYGYNSLESNKREKNNNIIHQIFQSTRGKLLIISNGGVMTGNDAYEKIKAGASLVQIYYPFIYYGPPRVTRIKKDLEILLKLDGYENISDAIGVDIRQKGKHSFFPFYD